MAQTKRGICHVSFIEKPSGRRAAFKELTAKWPKAALREDRAKTAATNSRIFGPPSREKIRVFAAGTPFQLKVWEALLRIPSGEASTYGRIAADG